MTSPPLLALCVCVTVQLVGNAQCMADEHAPSIDTVLAKWEEASSEIRTFDSKLAVFHYDPVFGTDKPKAEEGRFYFEKPRSGRFEVSGWDHTFVWQDKDILWIQRSPRTCELFSVADVQAVLKQNLSSWWTRWTHPLLASIQSPQECCPLVVDIKAAEIKSRYDLTMKTTARGIVITAHAKQDTDKLRFRKIDVLLDAKTFRTSAIQIHSQDARTRTAYAFREPKINEVPADRDAMINPKLKGYSVTRDVLGYD